MGTNLSVESAAKKLNVSVQRVRTLCREGHLDAEKIGGTWIIPSNEVEAYSIKVSHESVKNHKARILPDSEKKPIALSFFSGAMGLDLGVEKAGFEIRLACEMDKFCRQTIELNRPHTALLGDINGYSAADVLEEAQLTSTDDIDLVMGGPPCQAFSTAGKRGGFNDDRGNVFLKYLELALNLRPKFIVIENVRGLLSCPMAHRSHDQRGDGYPALSEDELKGGALNFVVNRLKNSGYSYSFNLYNAANFGTPQSRERVIIICARDNGTPPFLEPTHSENGDFDLLKWKTVRNAISDITNHDHLNFPEKRLKYYRMLNPGQNWRSLPLTIQEKAMGKSFFSGGGKTGFYRRLHWDRPSPTLVTHPAMPATDLAHPELDRPLSIQEYKRLQEFPDNWELAGPLIQQYKQVGNAVPVGLGRTVGQHILNLLCGRNIKSLPGFKYSRYKGTSSIEWEKEFDQRLHSSS
jgi:DNA (cytosine-5)-methyltransferase 1